MGSLMAFYFYDSTIIFSYRHFQVGFTSYLHTSLYYIHYFSKGFLDTTLLEYYQTPKNFAFSIIFSSSKRVPLSRVFPSPMASRGQCQFRRSCSFGPFDSSMAFLSLIKCLLNHL
jgi:hypothetical protein